MRSAGRRARTRGLVLALAVAVVGAQRYQCPQGHLQGHGDVASGPPERPAKSRQHFATHPGTVSQCKRHTLAVLRGVGRQAGPPEITLPVYHRAVWAPGCERASSGRRVVLQ
jgi:hypothetical protein